MSNVGKFGMDLPQETNVTIPLPTVVLRGIGKKHNTGTGDVLVKMLGAVNKAVSPAAQSGLVRIEKELKKTGKTPK